MRRTALLISLLLTLLIVVPAEGASKPRPKSATKVAAPTRTPAPAVLPLERAQELTRSRSLWSMADAYLDHARRGRIPGFSAKELEDYETRTLRREEVIEALVRYNAKVSPAFAAIEINDDYSNLPSGTVVINPPTAELKPIILAVRVEGDRDDREARAAAKPPAPTPEPKPGVPAPTPAPSGKVGRLYVDASMDADGRRAFAPVAAPRMTQRSGSTRGLRARAATKFVVLHSTATQVSESTDSVLEGIRRTRTAHFFIGRAGEIYHLFPDNVALDHAGDIRHRRRGALWNGEGHVSFTSIGIEVEAAPGYEWNSAQYQSLRRLLAYLGGKYHLRRSDIVTHFQVAYTPRLRTRGRKSDPYGVNWSLLGLPCNSRLIDWDVTRGIALANLDAIRKEDDWVRRGKRTQKRDDSLDGLIASDAMRRAGAATAVATRPARTARAKKRRRG